MMVNIYIFISVCKILYIKYYALNILGGSGIILVTRCLYVKRNIPKNLTCPFRHAIFIY